MLFINNPLKYLMLRAGGINGSTELWLNVSLATVLKGDPCLFSPTTEEKYNTHV